MDIVNPSEGTIDAVAQSILNKSAPGESLDKNERPEPEEDNLESVDDSEDTEAVEDEAEVAEDDTEDTEDDSKPQMVTVKIDGKSVEVPLEEALAGYQKDQDYRKKTAELAKQREEVEAVKAKVADLPTVRENYLSELKILSELTQAPLFSEDKLQEILRTHGAEPYLQAKAAQEKHQQKQETLRQTVQNIETQITEEQKEQLVKRESEERELLLTALPELKEPANQKVLGSYILGLGFSEDDVKNTLDHRLFAAMEKARRYDELISKGKAKPVANVPKVTKGNASRKGSDEIKSGRIQELSKQAKRSGSVDDLAQLLMAK